MPGGSAARSFGVRSFGSSHSPQMSRGVSTTRRLSATLGLVDHLDRRSGWSPLGPAVVRRATGDGCHNQVDGEDAKRQDQQCQNHTQHQADGLRQAWEPVLGSRLGTFGFGRTSTARQDAEEQERRTDGHTDGPHDESSSARVVHAALGGDGYERGERHHDLVVSPHASPTICGHANPVTIAATSALSDFDSA